MKWTLPSTFTGIVCLALAACGGGAAPASSAPASSSAGATSAAAKPSAAASAAASAKPAASAAASAKPAGSAAASGAASAKPAASGAAATTSGPLKIGYITSLTSTFAPAGKGMADGFNLYLQQAGMKAGGRDIQVITEDEAGDPKVALDKAKKLIEQDHVDILAGVILSPSTYAIMDYIEKTAPRKVLLVGNNAGANDMDVKLKSNYFVRTSFSNAQANIPMGAYFVNDLKITKVYVTYSDFAAGPEKIVPFEEGFKKAGGTIVGEAKPPVGTTDFAPFLTKILASDAQATYNFEPGNDGIAFVKQYTQFGLKNKIKLMGTGDNVDDTQLPAEGDAAVGAVTSMHYYSSVETPENQKFVADYQAKYNASANAYAVQGYDGARLIVDALNKTNGNADPAALMPAMLGAKWNSPRGPVTISPEFHDIVQNIYVGEVKNVGGKIQSVINKTFEAVQPVAQ